MTSQEVRNERSGNPVVKPDDYVAVGQVRELWAFRTSCLGTKRLMVTASRHFAKCITNRKLFERRPANPADTFH